MGSQSYPKGLVPDHHQILTMGDIRVNVPAVDLTFNPWKGEPIRNAFGGKALVDYEGRPMLVELAIRALAAQEGWSALWVETNSRPSGEPFYFIDWKDVPLSKQVRTPLVNEDIRMLMKSVSLKNGSSYAGCWDVLAWKGSRSVFIESKRRGKDTIRQTQLNWLSAGLSAGLRSDNFLLAEWDFTE